jgi:hypothetical protein
MASASDDLPIIPHEDIADVDCCGCLMVRVREGEADILCNECGTVIRTVDIGDVEAAMLEMARTDTICSARCTHCGALNTFPRFSTIGASICSECGEGVVVNAPVR